MKTKQNIRQLNKKKQCDTSDSSSDDDINLIELKKKNVNSEKVKNYCIVCNEDYNFSKEVWYMCKVCEGWANESCGHKGVINFYCQKCY